MTGKRAFRRCSFVRNQVYVDIVQLADQSVDGGAAQKGLYLCTFGISDEDLCNVFLIGPAGQFLRYTLPHQCDRFGTQLMGQLEVAVKIL